MQDLVLIVTLPLPSVFAQRQEEKAGGEAVTNVLSVLAFKGEISLLWGDLSNYLLSEPDIVNGTFFYQENKLFCRKASSLLVATASCMQVQNYKALT